MVLINVCVVSARCAGIMPHCLDTGTVRSVTVEKIDGIHWEETMKAEALKENSIFNRSKSGE